MTKNLPDAEPDLTFRSVFASPKASTNLQVPDYQRAFSWQEKQVRLFLSDLIEYQTSGRHYYFGHFIVENHTDHWEIVDGQQRITLFVLFLLVCRHHHPDLLPSPANSLLNRFYTVSYDNEALKTISARLDGCLSKKAPFDLKNPPASETLRQMFDLPAELNRSQRRIILALLQMDRAFVKRELDPNKIPSYIDVVLDAHCSCHLTRNKSVAVNIFEMHNTRGVPLTTLDVAKALLMKFVYDNGRSETERNELVQTIQHEFGQICGMEERLAERSFRGNMTTDQLLRHHLRAIDDNHKTEASHYNSPAADSNGDDLISYIRKRLQFENDDKTARSAEEGVAYAVNLAKEIRISMQIISDHLPSWDDNDRLVGDVMILEPGLSCEFFLIICRQLESADGEADGRLPEETLKLWETFLFIRDFHDAYHRLWYKDDFPGLFFKLKVAEHGAPEILRSFLADGFRDQTRGLQQLVSGYLTSNQSQILKNAFRWWKGKMIYALYKYEISGGTDLRQTMKKAPSVEHILPQEWQWEWLDEHRKNGGLTDDEKKLKSDEVGGYINGIGNLLLLTREENTSAGNSHPAEKFYGYTGGSYAEHNEHRERWRTSGTWSSLIEERGMKIFHFMRRELVGLDEARNDARSS
jgi:hypothetical protein